MRFDPFLPGYRVGLAYHEGKQPLSPNERTTEQCNKKDF
jgi:hypothetical protein